MLVRTSPRFAACLALLVALLLATSIFAQQDPQEDRPEYQGGHNERFLDPELDVDRFADVFESESREVFSAREAVTAALDIRPGMTVADIGAGTGAYLDPIVAAVGPTGHYFGVEISPGFATHIRDRAVEASYENVTSVLSALDSATLPASSIDLAFVCDTYHHFDDPRPMLASILAACKPGATMVIVDFDKVPGQSRQWILDHVRGTKEEFTGEIEAAGFEFVEQVEIDGLEENFFLRFRKP